tara:strand:+ start:114 stop:290 length:177 start_codon:yes stop_codon:yes gene_type:complete
MGLREDKRFGATRVRSFPDLANLVLMRNVTVLTTIATIGSTRETFHVRTIVEKERRFV